MFGLYDFGKFILAFFIMFPIVTLIHLLGHVFFVVLFGGKNIRIIIGSGDKLFALQKVKINKFYFWSGGCEFSSLKYNNRIALSFIFLGGCLFNLITMLTINTFIKAEILEPSVFWDQFIYFSFYFAFFAVFPMDFPTGFPSDGKALYLIWKDRSKNQSTDDCQWSNH